MQGVGACAEHLGKRDGENITSKGKAIQKSGVAGKKCNVNQMH